MDSEKRITPANRGDRGNDDGASAGYPSPIHAPGEEEGGAAHRTLRDYFLILRERCWYVAVATLVVFSSALIYTLNETRIYQSIATVHIFRSDPTIMQVQQMMNNDIRSAEDLNTQVKVMESATIIRRVADRITGDDLKAFLAPYEKVAADTTFVTDIIARNRKIIPQRLTLVVGIAYQHPDRMVAAKVANLFVEEYLNNNQRLRSAFQDKAVQELQMGMDDQNKKVEQVARRLQKYKEDNKIVSLDQRKDIVSESLRAINLEVQKSQFALENAANKLQQVKEHREKGEGLTGLAFVASQPIVGVLMQQIAAQQVNLATLETRRRPLHPEMIAAQKTFAETQRELEKAVKSVCDQVEAEHELALRNHRQRVQELEKNKAESQALDRAAVEYAQIERELRAQEQIAQSTIARTRETSMTSNIETQNARIVDQAAPSPENRPVSPNVPLNLGLGLVGGLGLGLALAFFVAFVDDRVKSSFDIEGVVGLPLVGIIPQIKRLEQADKAQIVANNSDPQVVEAFLSLHSSLRLRDESKLAKCILITSTIPGEGKSFTTTNLALTFAAHGERVVVVDCDLRKPNIHKSFRVENTRGVIDVSAGKAAIEDVVLRDVHPNLDLIPAGGRAKNPTQILNSKGFERMIADLRKTYDRVFIDTPPLAAVSDALIVLPLVDGTIFAVHFNRVRRKAAQHCAKRLLETKVPCFGAVLNGLNLAISGYYYAQYYDKSYKDYYVAAVRGGGDFEKAG
jgi:polysaccharide biosynthesis transport protein